MVLPLLKPMLATDGQPFDSPDYWFELKWDGYRCLVYGEQDQIRLLSRNGNLLTIQFPELVSTINGYKRQFPLILDGEIVIMDSQGKPSFSLIQQRGKCSDPKRIHSLSQQYPANLVVFDILYLKGEQTYSQPLYQRRALLEQLPWDTSQYILSKIVPVRGREFFSLAINQGLEGIMAKKSDSLYVPGGRCKEWLKLKYRSTIDCVIGGYVPSGGKRFKSLHLGLFTNGQLHYVGNVGTGFSGVEMGVLLDGFAQITTKHCPFVQLPSDAPRGIWLEPALVATVEYLAFTADQRLRHASFQRLRRDKLPTQCRLGKGET